MNSGANKLLTVFTLTSFAQKVCDFLQDDTLTFFNFVLFLIFVYFKCHASTSLCSSVKGGGGGRGKQSADGKRGTSGSTH